MKKLSEIISELQKYHDSNGDLKIASVHLCMQEGTSICLNLHNNETATISDMLECDGPKVYDYRDGNEFDEIMGIS